jgi:phage tail sheath gpL-like
MAYTTVITITHDAPVSRLGALNGPTHRGREAIQSASDLLLRLMSGNEKGSVEIQAAGTASVRASGTLSLSSAAGAVGGTIGGTLVTATAAGGDTNSAALVAAAINANATVNKKVYATSSGAVVTIKALVPGVLGNSVALVASGTGVTAGGATLTGGAGVDVAPIIHSRS